MFVILCYDVNAKRVGKMLKTAKKYLRPVQKSVFEGNLTEGTLHRLQDEIAHIILPEEDSAILYCCISPTQVTKAQLGRYVPHGESFL